MQGRYKAVVHICRRETQKAEVLLELSLASELLDKKKVFFKYVNNKRTSKENTGPILVEDS